MSEWPTIQTQNQSWMMGRPLAVERVQLLLDDHHEDNDGSNGNQRNNRHLWEPLCRFRELLGDIFLSSWLQPLYVTILDGFRLVARGINENKRRCAGLAQLPNVVRTVVELYIELCFCAEVIQLFSDLTHMATFVLGQRLLTGG